MIEVKSFPVEIVTTAIDIIINVLHSILINAGPRKVVFMARTGALIKQQSDRFKTYLPQFQVRISIKRYRTFLFSLY